ncbi:MAG: hypothetical protein WD894_18045 [Pirellulales bacterium]
MAQSGRSWNDPKSARGRASGSQPGATDGAGAAKPAGSSPATAGGGGRASWRSKTAPAVTQRGKDRHWLVSRTENPNRFRHRVKLAIAAGALLLLFGAFLVYTLWTPRNTPLLLVGIFDYAAPLPPNAWTFEDFDRFRSTLGEEGSASAQNIRVYSGLGERSWKNGEEALLALEQALRDRDMRPAGPDRNTVLIYVSGHGILDADGRPCLVLATDRGSTDSWQPQLSRLEDLPTVDLQAVLETIQESYADRSGVKKVVLLDCHRIHANPQFGILENRFGDALKRLQFKDENLFLLCSADAGQLAWTLPDRGASAFGYYVCQGLAGRADDTGNEDGIVTLDELERYLRAQISEQVQARYLVDQTPILLSAMNSEEQAAETSLAWAHPETESDSPDENASPVPWATVDELWGVHETLKVSGAASLTESTRRWRSQYGLDANPPVFYRGADLLSWEAFQQGLLRLEQLNDAGRHYTDEAQRLAEGLKLLANKLRESGEKSALPAALALRQVDTPPAVQSQVQKFIDGPVTDPDKEQFTKLLADKYERRAKAVWNRWVAWSRSGQPAGVADLRRTLDLLAPSTDRSTSEVDHCDPIEIRFLRLLDPGGHAPPELFGSESPALRSAILSRDLAEAAAWANDDVRVHYAVVRLVAHGDAARRRAEDQLFIQPSALQASGDPWKDAEKDYAQALALAVELSEAIDARDQAWQELPYLAHWLMLRHETEADLSSVSAEIARCQQLFAHNLTLADAIDRVMEKCLPANAEFDDETARRFADELEKSRQELAVIRNTVRGNLDDSLEFHRRAISDARLAAAPDVLNPREIRDLFSTPLLTGDDRRALRETLLTSRRNVALRTNRDEQSAPAAVPLKEHPLLALIGGDTAALAANPGRLAGKLRATLQARFNALPSRSAGGETTPTQRIDRLKLTAAEREARNLAALWTLVPIYREPEKQLRDPLAAVQEFDRHHALLWHADRALDDFWGREGDPRDAWYFDALATVALGEARGLGPGDGGAAYKDIDATLIERRLVAKHWVEVTVPSVQLPPAGSTIGSVDARPAISVATNVPTGEALLRADLAGNRQAAMRYGDQDPWRERLAVALRAAAGATQGTAPLDKPLERIMLQIPDTLANAGSHTWKLNVFYRGHLYRTEFIGSPKEPGQLYTLEREKPEDPRIIVYGEQRDSGAVVLIFDCSGSMEQVFRGVKPMNFAKPVLEETLDELAEVGTYRVALWLYGHRLGWGGSKGVVTQCEQYGLDSESLGIPFAWCHPETRSMSEDVGREWPPDPQGTDQLTMARQGELKQVLKAIRGFGVTPLFYSIIKALEEDPNLKITDAPRRLILLTDGLNNVNAAQQTPRKKYRSADVVRAMSEHGSGVDLHVIGFGEATAEEKGDPEIRRDAQEWKTDLPKIGKYHEVRNLRDNTFHELLRNLIGLRKYQVALVDRFKSEPISQRINRQVGLEDHSGRQQYDVQIVGSNQAHRVLLEGGEMINLYVANAQSANPRLVHRRYTKEESKNTFASIAAGPTSNAEKYYVGFQRTERKGPDTLFAISIQNEDATQFSPRPAEAWVEITPLGPGLPQSVKPFVFYDLDFVDGRPVPVLECRALNWPADASRARIKLFFKMHRTNTPLRRPVSAVEGEKPHPDLDVQLPEGGKVQFTVSVEQAPEYKGARITVTEHCARPADLHQAKVEIETPADIVRRQYFHSADKHEVRHDFIYTDKAQADLMEYRLRITSRQDLQSNAATLHDIIEIPVN